VHRTSGAYTQHAATVASLPKVADRSDHARDLGKLGDAIYANQGDAAADETPGSTKDDEDIIDAEVVNDEEPASDETDKDATK
jgi:hypothetical protein